MRLSSVFAAAAALLASTISALPAEIAADSEINRHGHHHHEHAIAEKFPQVQSLVMTDESVEAHHTEKYRESFGFAVRRGLAFDLDIGTNNKLAEDHKILFGFDVKKSVNVPHFNVTITGGPIEKDGDFIYRVSAICAKDSPVGRHNNFVVVIISAKAEKTGHAKEGHIYEYPFPFYVLPGLDEKPDVEKPVDTVYELLAKVEKDAEALKTEMEHWDDGVSVQL